MRYLYMTLIIIGAVAFLAGVALKIAVDPVSLPEWMAPPTLWRGAMGALVLAIALILVDTRNALAKN